MVTTLIECAEIKRTYPKTIIIADGGIRGASDILKSVACGADYVLCGKLLAATSLAAGPFYDKNKYLVDICNIKYPDDPDVRHPKYAEYAGMASHEMRQRNGSHNTKNISIEGEFGLIPYTGTTDDVICAIEANLRAGMSYCGARTWDEFRNRAVIQRISAAGKIEKETHLIKD
jgi:IMP dehydrogenase